MEKTSTTTVSSTTASNKLPIQATTSTTTNLQKIAPKPQLIKTQCNKIVYIKNGANQQILIGPQSAAATAGNTTTTSTATTTTPNAIQVIKTSDGNIIQIKNKITPTGAKGTAVAVAPGASSNAARIVLKPGGQRLVLASSGLKGTASGTTTTRTLTVSQAQQMGLLPQVCVCVLCAFI